jgi:hypothetical protein
VPDLPFSHNRLARDWRIVSSPIAAIREVDDLISVVYLISRVLLRAVVSGIRSVHAKDVEILVSVPRSTKISNSSVPSFSGRAASAENRSFSTPRLALVHQRVTPKWRNSLPLCGYLISPCGFSTNFLAAPLSKSLYPLGASSRGVTVALTALPIWTLSCRMACISFR